MLKFQNKSRIALWLICVLLSSSAMAQQKRAEPPKKPAAPPVVELPPALDTLLSDDAYRIYFEMRNVGQVARSAAVTELIGPLKQLMGSFDEIERMLKWTTEHADQLSGARLFVAAAPTRKALPEALVAVEFSSVEEAKKFQRQLRAFLPTLLPAPTPTPSPAPRMSTEDRSSPVPTPSPAPPRPAQEVTQEGPLVLVASRAVPLRDLKPRGAKLLVEDSNFNAARSRFASEPLFLYVNVASFLKEEREQREKWQEVQRKQNESSVADAAAMPSPETAATPSADVIFVPTDDLEVVAPVESPVHDPESTPATQPTLKGPAPAEPVHQPTMLELTEPLMAVLFTNVQPKWPDAIGAGLVLDDDSYTLRVLTINSDDSKAIVLPFIPQINSGPAITPASAGIFPTGTQLYLTLSLDYRELYSNVIKGLAMRAEQVRAMRTQSSPDSQVPATEAALLEEYERDLGFKIKDDLLPVLGNEIALAFLKPPPVSEPSPTAATSPQRNAATNTPDPTLVTPDATTPIVAVAIKDREAVKKLIGRLLEKSGLKGANLLAQTERRDDTELTTYGNFAAYAFVGDFIVVSPRAVLVRQVVDAYLSRQTLSSDSSFRHAMQWQPRQVQGQLYVSPSLVDMYFPVKLSSPDRFEALSQISSIDPLTYALTNDGVGPLHELRVPRNLLLFLIAGMKRDDGERSLQTNESIARSMMRTIASAETAFKATKGEGRYGTLDELVNEGLLSKDLVERYGYRIEVSALHNKFEATATPAEYGKTGRISFFIDDSGVLRAGDHGGGPATLADLPVDN